MLCSGAELGLTTDADGIMILGHAAGAADDLPGLKLGRELAEVAGDTVIDVDVKPNRGDALSLIGLAREVAAISGSQLRWPEIKVPESGDATNDHLWVEVADRRLCPRFVGRYVDGLKVGPSPLRVQLRLAAAGMRPISNAVDASNYVMLELGKPIHVFDAASVSGGVIVVRPAKEGETLETLDHVARALTPDTLVIADATGPIGIAGVMGGAGSEVGQSTSAAIVESAVFDPVSIRRTAQRFALRSEASLRFEKGQESRLARVGADRTAQLLAEWAGARVAVGVVDTNPGDEEPRRVPFRPQRVSRLLGEVIEAADAVDALNRIGIATEPGDSAEQLVALVPPHRRDISIEADVAEEICRIRGYETVPPRLPATIMPAYRPDPRLLVDRLRDLLSGRGLSEVVTNALIGPLDHERLGHAASDEATIRLENPVSVDHSELRRSMVPGLAAVLARNERQRQTDLGIFEIGATHEMRDGRPAQTEMLALLAAGDWLPASWAEPSRQASIDDLKGVVELIGARLGIARIGYRPAVVMSGVEHPGRTADVFAEADGMRVDLGRVGELDPRYLVACEVRAERAAFALIEIEALARLAVSTRRVRRLERLPVVERDLAVLVTREVPQIEVEQVIRANAGPYLAALALFDRYTGVPLSPGQVSLAYRLRFQPLDEPLADAVIDGAMKEVSAALAREIGGQIRSAD